MRLTMILLGALAVASSAAAQPVAPRCQHPHYEAQPNGSLIFSCDRTDRSLLLTGLYAGFVTLQVVDVVTTVRGGAATELNPFVPAGSPTMMVAFKVGSTYGMLRAAERLRRDHHERAAVLLMVGLNVLYTAVEVHNFQVAR